MELRTVPSLLVLTHLNIVELEVCDLYNKNGFYWLINRAQGRAWRKFCDEHQDRFYGGSCQVHGSSVLGMHSIHCRIEV